jgi:IS5 family transposase
MRLRYSIKPQFLFTDIKSHPVADTFYDKYNKIDSILESNSSILNEIHKELEMTMNTKNGRVSTFSTDTLFRMLLVKCIEQFTFRELIIRVNDSTFLRNFTRIGCGDLMGIGLLDAAWKCISKEAWDRLNKHLLVYAKKEQIITGADFRLDSTVCECNIHYPTDSSLLWDCYRVVSRNLRLIMDTSPELSKGFRFHEKKIKQLHTFISTRSSSKKKSTQRKVKKSMRILIERVEAVWKKGLSVSEVLNELQLNDVYEQFKELLQKVALVIEQSNRKYVVGEKVPAKDRIFSIFEDHTELLKRGKARKPIEFGHLVTLGQTKEKFISYYAVDSTSDHDTKQKDIALESHKKDFGAYPEMFAADKNYYVSMEDVSDWEEKIDTYGIGKKGRRTEQEYQREHSESFKSAQKFRAGCEGTISVLKRAFGLERCGYRSFKSFASAIGRLVFCHNLVLLAIR